MSVNNYYTALSMFTQPTASYVLSKQYQGSDLVIDVFANHLSGNLNLANGKVQVKNCHKVCLKHPLLLLNHTLVLSGLFYKSLATVSHRCCGMQRESTSPITCLRPCALLVIIVMHTVFPHNTACISWTSLGVSCLFAKRMYEMRSGKR